MCSLSAQLKLFCRFNSQSKRTIAKVQPPTATKLLIMMLSFVLLFFLFECFVNWNNALLAVLKRNSSNFFIQTGKESTGFLRAKWWLSPTVIAILRVYLDRSQSVVCHEHMILNLLCPNAFMSNWWWILHKQTKRPIHNRYIDHTSRLIFILT